MGLDSTSLSFLAYCARSNPLGNILTLGRQFISKNLTENYYKEIINEKKYSDLSFLNDKFCERLLIKGLGAKTVKSLDASEYENADFIQDLNVPLKENLMDKKFDTIVDLGTLEHVFNIPQAMKNINSLCRNNGQIIHVLPADNFLGHGFYQFSPELFFNLYLKKRGFIDTEVFLSESYSPKWYEWYRAEKPYKGKRLELSHRYTTPGLFIMVKTTKLKDNLNWNIQQSDYDWEWNKYETSEEKKLIKTYKKNNKRETKLEKIKKGLKSIKLLKQINRNIYELYKPLRYPKWKTHGMLTRIDSRKLL